MDGFIYKQQTTNIFPLNARPATNMGTLPNFSLKKIRQRKGKAKKKSGTKFIREKETKQVQVRQPQQKSNPRKKKPTENRFQVLEIAEDEEIVIIEKEKEKKSVEPKKDELVLMEIGQEDNFNPTLTQQAYIENLPENSQLSGGSVTRSKAKAHMEETSESRGEELKKTSRKGRNPNKVIREMEANREKLAGKQSSLDHLVRSLPNEKNSEEALENRKERVPPQATKK